MLPGFLSRTGANSVPKAASLAQSLTGLAVIVAYACGGWPPMSDLFFWLGTTGGLGILILLALTSAAVIGFFAAGDGAGARETGLGTADSPGPVRRQPAAIVVLAVAHYATLLGVAPGSPAAWLLPASFAAAAAAGLGWAAFLGPGARTSTPRSASAQQPSPASSLPFPETTHDGARQLPATAGHRVERADASDADVLAQVIADAFAGLDGVAVAGPRPAAPAATIFPGYFRRPCRACPRRGLVLTTPERDAVGAMAARRGRRAGRAARGTTTSGSPRSPGSTWPGSRPWTRHSTSITRPA